MLVFGLVSMLSAHVVLSENAETEVLNLPPATVHAEAKQSLIRPVSHSFLTDSSLRQLMVSSRGKTAEAMLLQSADVIPDEDGRMHVRGEDAAIQYIVDGIPMSGNQTRVYSSLFNTDVASSVDILSGGFPAQYGGSSAIVSVTTFNGFDKPLSFRAGAGSSGTSDWGTQEGQIRGSGRIANRTALFVAAAKSQSDRYLDPVSGFDPIHSRGESQHLFGKIDSKPMESLDIHLLGGIDAATFQIPNSFVGSTQDQKQELGSYLFGARADIDLGSHSRLGIAGYTRRETMQLKSSGLESIGSSSDSLRALRNEEFFLGGHRASGYHGGLIEFSTHPTFSGKTHRIRMGLSGEANPLHESLNFAVVDSNLSGALGDTSLRRYDLRRGGSPLKAHEERTGWSVSVYVQDAWDQGKWTFIPGLRYDAYHLFELEQSISPRFTTAYAFNSSLDLRGSLDYLVTRAPLENVLLSSSSALRPLAGSEQGSTSTRVGSEKSISLDLGANYRLGKLFEFDLSGYFKYIQNFIVKSELGTSGVIFPVNLKEGLVGGGLLKIRMREWNRLSATMSVGGCGSVGIPPSDSTISPVAAGLLVGEEGHNYNHPFRGEDFFQTEHNQIFTAIWSFRYRLIQKFFATMGGRFDAGLPFDLVDSTGKGLNEAESRAELKRRGYSDKVIDLLALEPEKPGSPDKTGAPHAIFDLGLDYRLRLGANFSVDVKAQVLNVLDTDYLYKFESAFGGTHFGQPRTFGLWISTNY